MSDSAGVGLRYFEDYTVGQRFELGPLVVTTAEITEFGRRFDPQSYHIDEDAATESLFGTLVASGWHVSASFMRCYVDTMLPGSAVEGSPGVDDMRWLQPVRPDVTYFASLTVLEKRPSLTRPRCGIINNECRLVDEPGETVMSMHLFSMFRKRAAAVTTDEQEEVA